MPQVLANPSLKSRDLKRRSTARAAKLGEVVAPKIIVDAPVPLRLWHLASLDAPTVAAVWSLGFGWAAGVRLPSWVPLLLALAAWAVYIADRLLDTRSALRSSTMFRLRQRHYFHWRHRRILVPLAVAAAGIAAWICLTFMSAAARVANSLLAVAALAYFTRVHLGRRGFGRPLQVLRFLPRLPIKELLVGLLFTAACALPALSRAVRYGTALWPLAVAAVFFAVLAWLNCHMIERWESGETPPHHSHLFPPACVLALAGLFLAAILHPVDSRAAAFVATGAISAILLTLLHRLRSRLTPLALRAAADLVLLCPLALLLQ